MSDAQEQWDDFYRRQVADIVKAFGCVEVTPAPTHAEMIKQGWAALREQWPYRQIEGRCVLVHDLGIIPDILYEQVKYGDQWVIEAEGVIVERLPIR